MNLAVPNPDVFHTLNYMYQRAFCYEIQMLLQNQTNAVWDTPLCMRQFFALARRAVIRVDPSIKHSVCRRCFRPLVDGLSCSTMIKGMPRLRYTQANLLEQRKKSYVLKRCLHCMDERTLSSQVNDLVTPTIPCIRFKNKRNLSQKQRRRRWLHAQTQAYSDKNCNNRLPYSSRMEGLKWDKPILTQGLAQGLDAKILEKVIKFRGGHVKTVGIGRNGQTETTRA